MKMSDFVSTHMGKGYDHGSGMQCYAGAEEYLSWGLGRTVRVPGYATASAWGANWQSTILGSVCKQVGWGDRKDGDIGFWITSGNHVAMYYQGKWFGQNQGSANASVGSPFSLMSIGAPDLLLRPNFITWLTWIIPAHTRALNQSEMNNNAKCMYGYLHIKYGWTLQACCGLLGNFQYESSINPNRWQSDAEGVGPGFGLAQWTPYTVCTEYLASRKAKLSDYGNFECDLLNIGTGYIPTSTYPLSFDQFKKSTMDAGDLALAFLYNYERPADPGASAFQARKPWAQQWYSYLKGWKPELPDGASEGGGTSYHNKFRMTFVNGMITNVSVITVAD